MITPNMLSWHRDKRPYKEKLLQIYDRRNVTNILQSSYNLHLNTWRVI